MSEVDHIGAIRKRLDIIDRKYHDAVTENVTLRDHGRSLVDCLHLLADGVEVPKALRAKVTAAARVFGR